MQDDMNQNNGMTVKQFVDIIKKGWVTILVSVLIVAVVFGSLLAILKSVATDTMYKGTMFISDDADIENRSEYISKLTSPENVNKAVTNAGYTDVEAAELVESVRSAISISGLVPESAQEQETVFVPTTYVVTMSPIPGLSEEKSIEILNNVMEGLAKTVGASTMGTMTKIDSTAYAAYDYMWEVDDISAITQTNRNVVNNLHSAASNADSSKRLELYEKRSKLDNQLEQLDALMVMIAEQGVTKADAFNSNDVYLTGEITSAQSALESAEQAISDYKEMIKNLTGTTSSGNTVTSSGTIVIDNSALAEIIDSRVAAEVANQKSAQEKLNKLKQLQELYNDHKQTPGDATDIEAMIAARVEQLNELFDEIANEIKDHEFFSTGDVVVIAGASAITSSALSTTVMLLALMIVIVLTVFFAFMHCRKRYMQQLCVSEAAAAQQESEALPEPQQLEDEEKKE